ncbi:MAG: cytochrome o ubiquinol oxidase subunit IV [Reyranella sp.]|nr:cytochrome o ubiquinol oxidase subunit IV [Reyranella sp.]
MENHTEHGLRTYLIGFVLAVVLTAIPFYVVITHALPPQRTLLLIAGAAILQVLVHLRFFLHLNFTTTPKENLLAIVFTTVLIFIMVGGSFWIMFDLHQRMAI